MTELFFLSKWMCDIYGICAVIVEKLDSCCRLCCVSFKADGFLKGLPELNSLLTVLRGFVTFGLLLGEKVTVGLF